MNRWVLVLTERGSAREGRRRRIVAVLAVLGVLVGSWGVGQVLATDPVGYGVPFWPFADHADRTENQLVSAVIDATRAGQSIDAHDVQVVNQAKSDDGGLFLTIKLNVDGETRCREAIVRGNSGASTRRVDC